jgi:hypothetical protein
LTFDTSDRTLWAAIIWRQFGAAIDMLENAVRACPDELWSARLWSDPSQPRLRRDASQPRLRRDASRRPESSEFWYVVYHTLFWLDLYLSGSVQGFAPPAAFTLDELDPAGLLPERRYTKAELESYLDHDRQKCRATIETLTDERARQRCRFSWGEVSYAELLLDNMRHVQEHAAQLNLFLGQQVGLAARWVAQTKDSHSSP